MSVGEVLVRWALVIGFSLLGAVTALAAVMLVITPQPGNIAVLALVAFFSSAIAIYFWRGVKRKQ